MIRASAEHLRQAGLEAHAEVKEGLAKRVLFGEAKPSSGLANCPERFLLGSVSAAAANPAEC